MKPKLPGHLTAVCAVPVAVLVVLTVCKLLGLVSHVNAIHTNNAWTGFHGRGGGGRGAVTAESIERALSMHASENHVTAAIFPVVAMARDQSQAAEAAATSTNEFAATLALIGNMALALNEQALTCARS